MATDESSGMVVGSLMSTQLISVSPYVKGSRIVELLIDENIGAVPVVDEAGFPIGIVTRGDVLEEDELTFDGELTAYELMHRSLLTVEPTTEVSEAARLMTQEHVHHLLVVDGLGRLVGMLSSFDVVRYVAGTTELYG